MNRKVRVITAILITALVLTALPLAAQESGTHLASRFWSTDVDNFMSYHDFTSVTLNKWFGFVGLGINANIQDESKPPEFALFPNYELGYAKKFGGLYLGAYYHGNFFASGETEIRQINTNYTAFAEKIDATDQTTIGAWNGSTDAIYTNNNLEALFGIGSMAIKVGFREELYGYTPRTLSSDITVDGKDNVTYEETKEPTGIKGTIDPYLGWGMNLELGSMVIKPHAEVGVKFVMDNTNFKYTINPYDGTLTEIEVGDNSQAVTPSIKVGAGLALPKDDGSELGFGLDVGANFDLYGNKYDVGGYSGTKAGIVNWGTSNATTSTMSGANSYFGNGTLVSHDVRFSFDEKTNLDIDIKPSVYYLTNLSDRASVGVYGEIGFGIGSSTSKKYSEGYEKSQFTAAKPTGSDISSYVEEKITTGGGTDTSESRFTLSPSLSTGVTFKVIPNRFNFNTGFTVDLFNLKTVTTKDTPTGFQVTNTTITKNYADGKENTSQDRTVNPTMQIDRITVTNEWQVPGLTVGLGSTLLFTENATFDVGFAIPVAASFADFIEDFNFKLLFTLKK